ncbi:MAG: FkbM family methyltransferase [Clostridia bacterium]|nr:FkbM family methyltransferase [Clostridia bacterium]
MKKYTLPPYPATEDVWDRLKRETRPLVVYGMGNGGDKMTLQLQRRGLSVADYMASDGFVRGHSFHGKRVLSLAEVTEKYGEFVLLLSFASSRPEVLAMLWEIADKYPLLMPDLPAVGDLCFDKEYYNEHYAEFAGVYGSLADDTSRNLYAATLHYKLTGDIRILRDAATDREEELSLLSVGEIRSYVDGGAYRGDTLAELLSHGAPLKEAVCVEPDRKNLEKLKNYGSTLTNVNVRCIWGALWDTAGEACFSASGNRNASLVGASYEHRAQTTPLLRLDDLCEGLSPDYIKYDVEGAERQALLGSALTVSRARPRLLVSLYHRTEDLWVLPCLVEKMCPAYDFYVRRVAGVPAWDLNLICIPRKESP